MMVLVVIGMWYMAPVWCLMRPEVACTSAVGVDPTGLLCQGKETQGIQVRKEYLFWGLKDMNIAFVGQFWIFRQTGEPLLPCSRGSCLEMRSLPRAMPALRGLSLGTALQDMAQTLP